MIITDRNIGDEELEAIASSVELKARSRAL
jgi:hypothetical protein